MALTQVRLDEESLLFAQRALTNVAAKVYEVDYSSRFKMANGGIIPVVVASEYATEKYIEIDQLDYFGLAEVIADYSKGGPRVGIVARRQIYPIRTIGDHAAWSWEEIQFAMGKNLPLQAKNLNATRIAFEAKTNKIGYFGDAEYGLPGILTSSLARMISASTFAAASSADSLLALLNSPVAALKTATNGVENPAKVVIPSKQFQQIGTTMRSANSDMSVLSSFLDLQQKMGQVGSVEVDDNLKGAGTNGEDVMLVLPNDEDAMCLMLAMDYTLLPVQQQNLEYVQHAVGRVIGTVVTRPLSGMIVEGI